MTNKDNSTPPNSNLPNEHFEEHNLEQDKTEVFDEADVASQLAINFADQAWKNHQLKQNVKKVTHPDFDGEHCFDCGIDIPPLRLKMGADRCTECQEFEDKYQQALKRR